MEAVLKFNCEDPEDARKHRRCLNADGAYRALWELDQWLRQKLKYSDSPSPGMELVREKLREVMDEANITFEDYL